MQGVSKKLRQAISSYGISICFKPHQTLHQILVAPKDKTKVEDQTAVVYRIPCRSCNKVYVGETKRSVGKRIKEHTAKIANNLSAVAEHHQKTGHEPDLDNVKVLCREDKLLPCKVREAIFIRKRLAPPLIGTGGVNFQNSTIHF